MHIWCDIRYPVVNVSILIVQIVKGIACKMVFVEYIYTINNKKNNKEVVK